MPNKLPIVDVYLLDAEANQAPFHLTFYGVPLSAFMMVPGGGDRIRAALERRGLTGYTSSPFHIYERPFFLQSAPRTAAQDQRWL
jgi:hypothetical protein